MTAELGLATWPGEETDRIRWLEALAQTAQVATSSVSPGLTQQAGDRFAEQVIADPLRGKLLGVQQDAHTLHPGLLPGAESTAEVGLSAGAG